GRLVHLAVNQRGLGPFTAALLVDAGLDEFVIEVVALAGALADTGEHRIAAMRLRNVVDEFLNQNRLADTGAAEQADLAAARIGGQQVEHLDAGDQDLRFRGLLDIFRRRTVNRAHLHALDRAGFVDRIADDVDDATEHARADRNGDRRSGVDHLLSAN